MLEEFKKFALRGNVVDLAIGVIIGAAFGAIVDVAGRRYHHAGDRRGRRGGLDFSNHFLPLSSKVTADTLVEAKKQGAVLAWGNFLTVDAEFHHHRLRAVPWPSAAIEPADARGGQKAPRAVEGGRCCSPRSAIC